MLVFQVWLTLPFLLAALPQTVFVIVFATPRFGAGQWWRDPVGKALFLKSLTLAAVFDVLAARVIYVITQSDNVVIVTSFPEAGIERTFGFLYWAVFAAVVYQLAVLIRQRRAARVR